ncbi:hypothetical protein NFI95_08075 [Acetobacteraceae bacterium KSS8]|uniref:HAD family hydrolase n=1 Tax=Endosaccharibacter trunci TaxID=2812733 RepID=A0ABT1W6M3_9PROT|nr:hypothetical protein [Acetobacteraceae bacterium KSS8]
MPAGWRLDARFLEAALAAGRDADLVTIDVFDTALTRSLDSPADLFAEVERRLRGEIGAVADGFAPEREAAERAARLSAQALHGAEEIDYEAILDRLPGRLSPWRGLIRRLELESEADALLPVPDLLELTRALAEAGTRFAFVSDMYLPRPFIEARLEAAGFGLGAGVFVSSETGATKATGRIWPVLAQRFAGARILHIGDDAHADIDRPRDFGIATLPYLRARSSRRTALPLSPASLPFSRARRAQVLLSRADPDHDPSDAAFWRELGAVWGGIVLTGFVRWLEQQVARHRIEQLLFCARDGWLILQAWRDSGAAARTGIDGVYFEVARRPLNLACGYVRGAPGRLDQALLGFLASSDGTLTVRTALRRAGLDAIPALVADANAQFGDLDTRLVWPDGTGRFEHLLQAHSSEVHAALEPHHAALIGYLRQSGVLEGGRFGLVDLGWHATMQRSLRTLLDSAGARSELHGFYYGLWPAAINNRAGAGPADSAFASDFEPPEERPELTDAVEVLEELHTAPHGTVTGYAQDGDGRWQAVTAEDPEGSAQFERAAKPFQDGCLATVRTLFETGRCGALALEEITPEVVRATLAAVTLSPDARELRLLGGLGHHATFDHDGYKTLVPNGVPSGAEARTAALRSCGWRMGTVLSWLARVPPEEAPELKAWVRHMMGHYGKRVLGRFE